MTIFLTLKLLLARTFVKTIGSLRFQNNTNWTFFYSTG